ncbi:hypothetical protein GTQ34_13895 [Muricauda sp. JGD-17]|uniref:Uncharacterized protein n=1 Tax=Flagellimonas ochracea TaxID=2696472 RepID=A0A964TDP4_9FLAO|nr:hypothetical protein [Allomuricauda ochracea]NAY93012.1 hypothetical protein [Allomuricauda ochracea]
MPHTVVCYSHRTPKSWNFQTAGEARAFKADYEIANPDHDVKYWPSNSLNRIGYRIERIFKSIPFIRPENLD